MNQDAFIINLRKNFSLQKILIKNTFTNAIFQNYLKVNFK